MKIVPTNSVWIQFILLIILMGLGLGLLTLSQNPVMMIVGDIWIVLGIIGFFWYGYVYTTTKNGVIEYFSVCPICGSPNILTKLVWGFGLEDTHEAICQDCGARLIIKTSGWTGKIKIVKLVKPSDNGAGQEYLGKETEPEFWVTIARRRKWE